MKVPKYLRAILLILVLAGLIISSGISCLPVINNRDGKTIVITYSILGSMGKQLVGDKANVIVSVPNGLDPHEWEPSAKDIETINKADMVIQNGLGLESSMEKTLESAKNNGVKFFTASDHISIRYVGPGEGIPAGDPDQAIGAPDPHFWTDPLAMRSVVAALALQLNKDLNLDVASQASLLEKQLDDLNKEIADMVSTTPPGDRKLVTGHESMGYFAQRYGFKLVGVIIPSLSSQAGVSAADLAALKKAIQDNQVKAIFTELGTSPTVAETIGRETGIKVVELATHTLPADGSYLTFMKNLAGIIVNALR